MVSILFDSIAFIFFINIYNIRTYMYPFFNMGFKTAQVCHFYVFIQLNPDSPKSAIFLPF